MERHFNCLKLPRELISLLVNDWLNWEDVARWDSAICSKEHRLEWLDILKTNCLTKSISISFGRSTTFSQQRWFVLRCIRARELLSEDGEDFNDTATICWLEHAGPRLERLLLRDVRKVQVLENMVRVCVIVKAITFYCCLIDDRHWECISTIINLEELNLYCQYYVPTELSLPFLCKLTVRWASHSNEDASALLRQLPALRSLRLTHNDPSDICKDLAGACANLVHLDLQDLGRSCKYTSDGEEFVLLMRSLQKGLRCLILPEMMYFTARDLQSITEFHGHSLRCISIPNYVVTGHGNAVVELLNSLPLLKTAVMSSRALLNLLSPVLHSNITHLYVEMDRVSLSFLGEALIKHFPSLTALSIDATYTYLVSEVVEVLTLLPSIHTIYVTREGPIATELQKLMPRVTVKEGSRFDMFCTDY